MKDPPRICRECRLQLCLDETERSGAKVHYVTRHHIPADPRLPSKTILPTTLGLDWGTLVLRAPGGGN